MQHFLALPASPGFVYFCITSPPKALEPGTCSLSSTARQRREIHHLAHRIPPLFPLLKWRRPNLERLVVVHLAVIPDRPFSPATQSRRAVMRSAFPAQVSISALCGRGPPAPPYVADGPAIADPPARRSESPSPSPRSSG